MIHHYKTSNENSKQSLDYLTVTGEFLVILGGIVLMYIYWLLYDTPMVITAAKTGAISSFQEEFSAGNALSVTKHYDEPPDSDLGLDTQVYGVLHVPKWDYDQIPIAEGTSSLVLDQGFAGHYTQTQQMGEIGNFALAGHRRTYGHSFRKIDELEVGDWLVVETSSAYLVYQVTGYEIVYPDQVEVLLPVPHEPDAVATARIMTLTTCHPWYSNTQRYILYSEMRYWVDKQEGKPEVLAGETDNATSFSIDNDAKTKAMILPSLSLILLEANKEQRGNKPKKIQCRARFRFSN